MNSIKKLSAISMSILVAMLLSACGSMFPSAPAEKAADRILDDILVKKPKDTQVAKPQGANS
jgi:PBP1b-binding outer membrane lipoprotein LpoB